MYEVEILIYADAKRSQRLGWFHIILCNDDDEQLSDYTANDFCEEIVNGISTTAPYDEIINAEENLDKKQQKHTPTPWYTTGKPISLETHPAKGMHAIVGDGGPDASDRYVAFAAYDDADINAAFIVRACNSHAALVDALENAAISIHDARKALMDAPDFPDRVKVGQDLGRRLEEVQSALALAKGE